MKEATREVSPAFPVVKLTDRQISNFIRKIDRNGTLPDQSNPHYHGLAQCWVWTGAKHTTGYGVIRTGKKIVKSHRAAWVAYGNEIQEGQCVLHRCDNRMCCNPSHLFLGSRSENTEDRHRKGRSKGPVGEKNARHLHPEKTARGERQGNAALTDRKVREILAAYKAGESQRKIADRYGVAKSTIGRVVRRTHWRHVQ